MSLDYGINPGIEEHLILAPPQKEVKYGFMILDDRASCYPNTYGMYSSSLSEESITNLLVGYYGFDSVQLRDKYNPDIVTKYIEKRIKQGG